MKRERIGEGRYNRKSVCDVGRSSVIDKGFEPCYNVKIKNRVEKQTI